MNKEMNALRVNFNLEVLHGCKWNCVGCYVDTGSQNGFIPGDLKHFQELSKSFVTRGLIPSILILGPTDIFVANNRMAVLTDCDFIELSKSYERLTLTSTFRELDYEVLRVLAQKYNHLEIEFKIIIDLPVFNDDKFLSQTRSLVDVAKGLLSNCKKFVIHPQLNLFNAPAAQMREALSDYLSINERSYKFFDEGVDYAISFGRRAISKEYQRKAFQLLKNAFNQHISSPEVARDIHFDTGNLLDIGENIFTYKEGEFFYAPKLYDEYVTFDSRYKIPVARWHADEFIDYQQKLLVKQYEKKDAYICADCSYLATCINKGVVDFLDYIGTKQCLFPRHALNMINIGRDDGSLDETPI